MRQIWMGAAALLLMAAVGMGGAWAQAPAGAPAGATGICKDGTYTTQAGKGGACRGHKGVQTWYAAETPAAASAAARASAPAQAASLPPASGSAPATVAAPSSPTTPARRIGPAQAAAQNPAAPGGGPGLVWVNTTSNVYHCNGDPYYGRTKNGKYVTEDQAKAMGARGDRGKTCAAK